MVPLGDMFNHKRDPADASWEFREDGEGKNDWYLHAVRDIAKGEEVGMTYGKLDNMHLLVNYGFVIPNNPVFLSVKVKFPGNTLNETDLFFTEKQEIIKQDFEVNIYFDSN